MRKNRKRARLTWFKAGLLLVSGAMAGSLYTPYPARLVYAWRGETSGTRTQAQVKQTKGHKPTKEPPPAALPADTPPPAPSPAPVTVEPVEWKPDSSFSLMPLQLPPFPPALPERVEPGNYEHIGTIIPGLNLRSNVRFTQGETATLDRKRRDAYAVHISLELLLPHAANGQELLHANPELRNVLRNYDTLMSKAKVSPWFHSLYLHKQNQIRKNAATLNRLLDRHNFFDTDTMLEIKADGSNRHVLWIQADMDVVSDGSDGDRLPVMPDKILRSDNYQPGTSYRWKKRTDTPNPLLPGWQARLERLQKDKNAKSEDIRYVKSVINDLKTASFLLAQYDPFIVVPLTVKEARRDRDNSFRPQPGDYAVVIAGKRVFPAIVGDFGPRYKTGEASLRLCKAVNPKSDVYARAVSDLGVSYLIFPGSKEPVNAPIDYARLNSRCRELLDELGGLGDGAVFVDMQDELKPADNSDSSQTDAVNKI